ncbi:MAG: hypothetical protein FWD71_21490, partial [Oscillospiraceae bacterium]|nr:hypothetical protein [Oscillospiraceae bacterium]
YILCYYSDCSLCKILAFHFYFVFDAVFGFTSNNIICGSSYKGDKFKLGKFLFIINIYLDKI